VGLNFKTQRNVTFFGELDYRKGSGVESPVQANVGLRVNF